jgi:predicted MFS family arabinose efflux permease
MNTPTSPASASFSGYQKVVVGMLAFLQFAVILDFMLMSPLGALIMPALSASPAQFGTVVSAYAFAAGISGLLTAGFADRFDRKKLLLFFYTGFIAGTAWCGVAQSFESLLLARIVTGLFGGVIGSIVLAIATDLFAPQMRGRVMGFIQTAFAASQVLGIPIGIYLSNRWNWHVPFLALVVLGLIGGLLIALYMKPVADHLKAPQKHSAFEHLRHTVTEPRYLLSFVSVLFLATGGFMLMPFSSAFTVNNLGISLHDLPIIYLVTGIATIFVGPLIGKAADALGKMRVFYFGNHADHHHGADLHAPEHLDAARRDRDQRRAVRRNLLAHDSVSGTDVAGARVDATRLVQRDQCVHFAAGRRACVTGCGSHRRAGSGWADPSLRHRRLCRRRDVAAYLCVAVASAARHRDPRADPGLTKLREGSNAVRMAPLSFRTPPIAPGA